MIRVILLERPYDWYQAPTVAESYKGSALLAVQLLVALDESNAVIAYI
jgi:hypothetical protein